MRNRAWRTKAGLTALLLALCGGLVWIGRLSSGSGYPWPSSLSTAPAGSNVLYQVLQRSGRFSFVERNYLPLDQFHPVNATVFYLGIYMLGLANMDDRVLDRFEAIAKRGNRLVLGVSPGNSSSGARTLNLNGGEPDDDKEKFFYLKRWGLRVRRKSGVKPGESKYAVEFGPEWRPVHGASVWERPFGGGSVMIVKASLLSNRELVRSDDARAVVPVAVKGASRIWFEESHLGIQESGSIAGLMRRYHMEGSMAGLLLLTALLLWRNAVRFPPAMTAEQDGETVMAGSGSHAMLTALLARHLAPERLMEVCVAEWNRTEPRRKLKADAWRGQDPVSAYKEIAAELQSNRMRKI